ncbi:MAG: starch-binding protein, partial [Muribaculaceae bacterium]|nr:starch-binding protein [Muribaculaceae bacterium]
SWGATNDEGVEKTGSVTYKKIDPNAAITIYVNASSGNIYVWGDDENGTKQEPFGGWPGKAITSGDKVGDFYSFTIDGLESVNCIFNGDGQTGDITGIDSDVYYEYDGGSTANKVDGNVTPQASVSFSPNGGNFSEDEITVTATAKNAVSAWYKIGNGAEQNFSSTAEFKIGQGMENGDQVVVSWSATNSEGSVKTGSVTFTKKTNSQGDDPIEPTSDYVVYFENSSNWSNVYAYAWSDADEVLGAWPGKEFTQTTAKDGKTYYIIELPSAAANIIFNNGSDNGKTGDLDFRNNGYYNASGYVSGGDDPIIEPTNTIMVYFDNSSSNWDKVYAHYWGASESTWPGVEMQKCEHGHYFIALPAGSTGVVFNQGNDQGKTRDFTPTHKYLYDNNGEKGPHECSSGVDAIEASQNDEVRIFNLQGVEVNNPGPGIYIVVKGKKVSKIRIN